MVNLQEAFSKLSMLESGDFDLLNQDEKDAMKSFLDEDEVEAEEVDIIDPQAENEFDLEDSYVGKIVVQCPVCRSLIYKTQEELDEEGDEAQTCPYCFSVEKFDLIGKIVPLEDETAPEVVPEEPVEESVEKCPKCGKAPCVCEEKCEECDDKDLKEDLENVTIETDDEVINISAEEKPEVEDMPLDLATEEDAEPEHETAEVIAPLDDEEDEIDEDEIDEVDEDSFDDFAESLLREKYSNIVSYKTTKMKDCGNHVVTEGVVTLKNGQKKLTEFRIRPSKFSRNGKGACLVENLQLKTRKVVRAYVK